jgi:molybdenum cofactor guanylyltransferase
MNNAVEITGFVLAGGKSSRMGCAKGLVEFQGKPMILHMLEKLQPLCTNVYINSNEPDYQKFGYSIIPDIIKDIGPIGGLYACLKSSNTKFNVFLPCDVPLLDISLIEQLIHNKNKAQIVIPVHPNGHFEPLISVFQKSVLTSIAKNISQGIFRVDALLNQNSFFCLRICNQVKEYSANQFHNINTRSDIAINDILF